jgi:competence ComEA-like helix-hairpin-helix protein
MSTPQFIRLVYRLQQQVGMTPTEFRASLFLAALLLGGSVVNFVASRSNPIDPAVYAENDAYFNERRQFTTVADTIEQRSPADSTAGDSMAVADSLQSSDHGYQVADDMATPVAASFPIDINRANATQLEMLPRIGPALSGRIVDFRRENGPFRFVEDLLMVRGIGDRTLERLRPLITVNGIASPGADPPAGGRETAPDTLH